MIPRRLLFVGLGHLSKGDVSIAADIARQLPRPPYRLAFVCADETRQHLHGLGLPAVALDAPTPEANARRFTEIIRSFRPEALVVADPYTLNYSTGWSGVSMSMLRDVHDGLILGTDQYEWASADHVVDFYGNQRMRFPHLLDQCDLAVRNVPLNRPSGGEPGVVSAPLLGGALDQEPSTDRAREHTRTEARRVFLATSKWEYVNVTQSRRLGRLMAIMPRIVHDHLARLGTPVEVVHVGPVGWDFPTADSVNYRHFPRLPPHLYRRHLHESDLFVTTNVASVTLYQAALHGVPSLVLQNHKILDLRHLVDSRSPDVRWLRDTLREVDVVYPFRVFPWGWHDFLTPVLRDNPFVSTFSSRPVFEASVVAEELARLLFDRSHIADLRERQAAFRGVLSAMPPTVDALEDQTSKRGEVASR